MVKPQWCQSVTKLSDSKILEEKWFFSNLSKKNLSWIYPSYQELQILFPKNPQFFVSELLRPTLTGGRLNTREKDGVRLKVDGTMREKDGERNVKKSITVPVRWV